MRQFSRRSSRLCNTAGPVAYNECGGQNRTARPWGPKVNPHDEALLHDMLHHLATHGPPNEASSPELGDGDAFTIELAGRGLGPAGSVQVPDDLWVPWADPRFERAGEEAPTAEHSPCPAVRAPL